MDLKKPVFVRIREKVALGGDVRERSGNFTLDLVTISRTILTLTSLALGATDADHCRFAYTG